MSDLKAFVEDQVTSNEELEEAVLHAVLDGDIPLCNVELSGTRVEKFGYERSDRTFTIAVEVDFSGDLVADPEGEVGEGGTVHATVRMRHGGQALEYVDGRYDVRYSMDDDDRN